MRVRLFIPLPGPFAITSGQRRPRESYGKMQGGRRGILWFPTVPVRPHPMTCAFWVFLMLVAVAWDVIALVLIMPARWAAWKVQSWLATEVTPATAGDSPPGRR